MFIRIGKTWVVKASMVRDIFIPIDNECMIVVEYIDGKKSHRTYLDEEMCDKYWRDALRQMGCPLLDDEM